jgi:hypothetical protein
MTSLLFVFYFSLNKEMLQCIKSEKNVIEKTKKYLKILNLVHIELSLVCWICADVVTEAVVGVHVFVAMDFDELIL